ncbi:MAG: agmatinase [Euryarchaeota archaeon RBG_16_62_10]|nr:MAG: agmatinase [Euryarchaeota archaeon RBG_16_62_10]
MTGGPRVALVGVPFDGQSSFRKGASQAPSVIRSAWHSPSSNMYSENGTLVDDSLVRDLGDVQFPDGADPFSAIESKVDGALKEGYRPICLGGDHSITYPIVKSVARVHRNLNILHIDAHPDIYESYEGSRLSHACPFARIMEDRLASRLVQVGIRTMSQHQRDQAARFGVEAVEMKDWTGEVELEFSGPLYLSLDIDALDPAFAPGVSHREPGGLSTRDVIRTVQSLTGQIVAADIVEFNPVVDTPGMTDMVCAKLLKEIAARMASDSR